MSSVTDWWPLSDLRSLELEKHPCPLEFCVISLGEWAKLYSLWGQVQKGTAWLFPLALSPWPWSEPWQEKEALGSFQGQEGTPSLLCIDWLCHMKKNYLPRLNIAKVERHWGTGCNRTTHLLTYMPCSFDRVLTLPVTLLSLSSDGEEG